MIDTHAHIDTEIYDDDRLELIEEAFKAGIEAIIIPAIEPKDFKRVLQSYQAFEKLNKPWDDISTKNFLEIRG